MKYVYDMSGVCTALGNACAHGLTDNHGVPLWKVHRWLCNDTNLLHAVCRDCPGHAQHARVEGSNTKISGVYTDALADAILHMLSVRKKQALAFR